MWNEMQNEEDSTQSRVMMLMRVRKDGRRQLMQKHGQVTSSDDLPLQHNESTRRS